MRIIERALAVGSTTAVLGVMAFTASAHASESELACTIAGEAKTSPPVQLIGGSGSYEFDALAFTCVVSENGSQAAVVSFDVTSNGTYESVVCGTGIATSAPGNTTLNNVTVLAGSSSTDYAAAVSQLGYEVEFAGATGILSFTSESPGIQGAGGPIELGPSQSKGPGAVGECAKGFSVIGAVEVLLSDAGCKNEPEDPVKVGTTIEGKSKMKCLASQFSVAGCAILQRKVGGKWIDVGAKGCEHAFNATESPLATSTTACVDGTYRTLGRGSKVPDSGRVREDKGDAVTIKCSKSL